MADDSVGDHKLRIGFVSDMEGAPWGGSEALWSQAALRLRAQGVVVGVNVKAWPQQVRQVAELEAAGCVVERRQYPSRFRRLIGKLRAEWSNPFRTSWFDRFRPDLIVVSQGCQISRIDWIQRCISRKVPFAIVVQAAGEQFAVDDSLADVLAPVLEAASGLYFVSEGNAHFVRRQLAIPLPHAKVVRNPFQVPYDVSPPWPVGNGDGAGVLKLACVARLDCASKGQELLLDVLQGQKWRSRRIEVTLFGSGPNARTLESLKRMYGLENVVFGGFAQDVESIWQNHHALVLPSRVEGLPIAVVEAMLCGRVCIVTDVAGNAELLEDNRTGFVAAATTVQSLDEAMERAWVRRAEWPEMGRAAARRVRELVPRDPARVFADELLTLVR